MVKVSIAVRDRTARLRVGVHAPSIEQALSIAQARYPGSAARVSFPSDPESFFVEDIAA
jgi:hypothetical protein